jgi:hypothetical protein
MASGNHIASLFAAPAGLIAGWPAAMLSPFRFSLLILVNLLILGLLLIA